MATKVDNKQPETDAYLKGSTSISYQALLKKLASEVGEASVFELYQKTGISVAGCHGMPNQDERELIPLPSYHQVITSQTPTEARVVLDTGVVFDTQLKQLRTRNRWLIEALVDVCAWLDAGLNRGEMAHYGTGAETAQPGSGHTCKGGGGAGK